VVTFFTVWAPEAGRVDLTLDQDRIAMSLGAGGWWSAQVAKAGPGTRYAFSLDGGPARPDPRSPSQPEGVDADSEVVDHGAFAWTDQRWRGLALPGAVLYELHVGTFSAAATFDGVIEHLDHLVDLGVDAIEVMPVAEFSGVRGWGYDGVDLFAPHHAYGGPDGFKRLVDACHARGLGVVLDVVYNHLGPAGNYLGEFGPYFSDRHSTNWGDAVNFDGPQSGQVRRFVIDNALMWLRDYHCDGLRLDAVHAIIDESATHLLEELQLEVQALAAAIRRPLFLIAESDLNDPRFVLPPAAGGYGLAAAWADEWHHALHAALSGERDGYYEDFGSLELLAKAIRQAWVYDGVWSAHRRRVHGRPPTGLMGHQFVVCTQNHDQVGNRAAGDRAGALMSAGRLRIAAALLLTSPFTPMLFQGEEWGASTPFQYFTDHQDRELGQAVSQGRRSEFATFGWDPEQVPDPQAEQTWARSVLDWSEPGKPEHAELLDWHRELLALRRRIPALADPRPGRVQAEVTGAGQILLVRRGAVLIAVNLGSQTDLAVPGVGPMLAASDPGIRLAGGRLHLPPDSVAIVQEIR
jgi:maltooligosyltrehalose trehalohydrolase